LLKTFEEALRNRSPTPSPTRGNSPDLDHDPVPDLDHDTELDLPPSQPSFSSPAEQEVLNTKPVNRHVFFLVFSFLIVQR